MGQPRCTEELQLRTVLQREAGKRHQHKSLSASGLWLNWRSERHSLDWQHRRNMEKLVCWGWQLGAR